MSYEGTVILNYRLGRKLGEGGFGSVYLAEHTELGRKSACKILHREYASKPDVVDRFFREAKAVCEIGNRAIIEIENFGRLPTGEPFYLMEYFPGEALADRVARAPLRAHDAIAVFDPIASALTAAHRKNIIHRDLKPENIMVLEEDGRVVEVKLLDFGIAKLLGDSDAVRSRSGMPMGTPAYMAPEQARDSKNVDARADVYSFGATVFAAFAGRAPFSSDSIAGLLLKVQTDPPESLATLAPSAPPALQTILERCMAKEPARRPPSIHEAWREIQGALRGVAASAGAGVAETLPPDAPTIAPTMVPERPAAVAASTTLGGAASQNTSPREMRPRWPWIAVALIAAGAVATVVVVAMRGDPAHSTPAIIQAGESDAAVANPPPDASDSVAAIEPRDALDIPAVVADAKPEERPKPKRKDPKPKLGPRLPPKVEPEIEPKVEPAKDPPKLDCSTASFARIYEQQSPPEELVRAALARLRRCESQLPADRYKRIQQNLVSKL